MQLHASCIVPLSHASSHAPAPPPQPQQARLSTLLYSISSHILVDSNSCDMPHDFTFAAAIADRLQVCPRPPPSPTLLLTHPLPPPLPELRQ